MACRRARWREVLKGTRPECGLYVHDGCLEFPPILEHLCSFYLGESMTKENHPTSYFSYVDQWRESLNVLG